MKISTEQAAKSTLNLELTESNLNILSDNNISVVDIITETIVINPDKIFIFASLIITLGGVSNIIKGDWVIKVFSMMIFGGFIGGWYVKSLLKDESVNLSEMEIEKYKFLIKSIWGSSIALLVMALIIYL